MQGSFLVLFAGEPPRGTCQFGQASLARHLKMTPTQDRTEPGYMVLTKRFKAQRRENAGIGMKNAPRRARRTRNAPGGASLARLPPDEGFSPGAKKGVLAVGADVTGINGV
ncbi:MULTISPECIES: hypothetical protein [Achromobacter]|jgi:hypothetical protein|uniref:Uncharacterized protein n=1 Tax=Achromobacter denitrificans TaxID=32002 RepID=A0A6N0JTL9_ACHDE|nr:MULTISPECIES: hypothetical protein [Achromobacter]MDF3856876.1 hypothetical protein [Achromobacter denitrificans]QKQ50016.1 hypothetical protein FOC81_26235 [Achromobacter denitrificans]